MGEGRAVCVEAGLHKEEARKEKSKQLGRQYVVCNYGKRWGWDRKPIKISGYFWLRWRKY